MASSNESRSVNIYINGNSADQTLKQIEASSRKLRAELRQLVPGTEAFRLKAEELRSVNERLQAINDDVRGVGGAFGWLKTEIGKLGALAVGYLGFQFVTEQFHNIISANAQLSDSLAEVRRVTGLTTQEVSKLNKGFKDIDTRTSVAGLRNIAVIAGKLGVAKDDILDFTQAVDKLVVTLGDELGNADAITTQLGKILNVYDGKVTGENITHLGNAIVVLANAGVASGGFIADFTQRVSGIAVSAHLSLGATMGLAAGLEELGQKAESSSTAISRLLTDIAEDLPKAAKVAQMPLEQFQKLFSATPEKALLAYASGLVKNKTAFNDVATAFKDAGEEGQRVIGTLSALGNKAQFLQEKVDLSNKALTDTAAINEGFAIKNETFGATVDKLGKKFSELSSNKGLTGLFESIVNLTIMAIDGFNKYASVFSAVIKLVVAGTIAYVAYNSVLLIAKVTQKQWILGLLETESAMKLVAAAQTAWTILTLVFQGRIKEARQAMVLFNATLEANPIGLVVAAFAALVTAAMLFKTGVSEAAAAQDTLNKVHDEAVSKIGEEKDKIEDLTKIIYSQNEAYSDRIAAIKILRTLLPDHLKGYTDEQIMAKGATTAVNEYVKSLERKAEAEAAFDELKRLKAERIKIEQDKGELSNAQIGGVMLADVFQGSDAGDKQYAKTQADNLANQLAENTAQQNALKEKYKLELKNQLLNKPGTTTADNTPSTPKRTSEVIEKEIADLQKEQKQVSANAAEWKKYQDQIDKLKAEDERITGKQTGTEKSDKKKVESLQAQSKKLSDIVRDFNSKQLIDQESTNQKELDSLGKKYDDEIKKLEVFQTKIKASTKLSPKQKKEETDKHQAEIDQLNLEKSAAVNAMRVQQEIALNNKIRDLRTSLGEVYQTELSKESDRINNFYDDLLASASDNEDEWFYIEQNRAKDLTDAKLREAKRFQAAVDEIQAKGAVTAADKEKVRRAEINKKYDDEIQDLKRKFSKEIQATKEFQKTIDTINKNRDKEIKQKTKVSDKEVQDAVKDQAFASAQTISDGIFDINKANRQADTDNKIATLEKQKEVELSNKNLTEAQRTAITDKYAKKEADIKLDAWEKDKAASLQQAEINGILAVTKAMTSAPWPLNLISAAGAAVAAGVEIAKISDMKPPQFEDGGYSAVDYKNPQGYVNQPTLFAGSSTGRPFIAGEGHKTEYIISSQQLKDPVIADFVRSMESNRGVRRFEAGGYSGAITKTQAAATKANVSAMRYDSKRLDRMEMIVGTFIEKQAKINSLPVVLSNKAVIDNNTRNTIIKNEANA